MLQGVYDAHWLSQEMALAAAAAMTDFLGRYVGICKHLGTPLEILVVH